VVKNMFKQNIKMKKQKKVTKTTEVHKQSKTENNNGVHFHAEKDGMCTGKKKDINRTTKY